MKQKTRYKVKLAFEKKDPMCYFSQLDLVRMLERALRRTQLPVSFTQGFNPRVKLSFSPALKLGVEGVVDVTFYFTESVNAKEVVEKLHPQLPRGLIVKEPIE